MGKFENRFLNYEKAVRRLGEVIKEYKKHDETSVINTMLRDSVVQRFEICYELAWKTMKEYMIEEGVQVEIFPKAILKVAYQNKIIHNEEIWLNMIKDRNMASHEYNEEYIVEVVGRIETDYYEQFYRLYVDFK